eukprot:CAMPEP_0171293718 /NCGR_PEP_ID=MMETSP0816-20121228/2056_1 /TAXON_ID=420281 /ORGANISM="Proboscia inermis, Strain CCAP1064/1" /LENGTH=279 /DNA_ID=CAMNT_0011764885 /DNA_START=221 /DNA_END=1060 /DNA_ORIENTATION=-
MPVTLNDLHVVYADDEIVVVDKPSGILCVPGPRRNPSILGLVFELFGCESGDIDKMVVHRLDMDTSGIVVFARTNRALRVLHDAFRFREVKKTYEAIVCGHMKPDDGEIDLPLRRDYLYPPFMRISTPESDLATNDMLMKLGDKGFARLLGKSAKSSLTDFRVLSRETLGDDSLPVTRVELMPWTGRTHQLRVHCAALGHPIVADDIYGYNGEGCANAGFSEAVMEEIYGMQKENVQLQRGINSFIEGGTQGLCLHAKELALFHPSSGASLIFKAESPF